MPSLIVVGGPNGSGKSTLTRQTAFGEVESIDPDAIARELPRDVAYGVDVAAAREALRRQQAALAASRSFLVETTLSGRGTLRLMKEAGEAGYWVSLHFVCVASPDQSVLRVRHRARRGGHSVPEQDIRRRFRLSLAHLPEAMALADESVLYDNRRAREPHRRVAVVTSTRSQTEDWCPDWAMRAVADAKSIRRETDRKAERGMGQQF